MSMKHLMTILGTTLPFSVGEVRVLSAQEQGAGPAASETASEKRNPSSRTEALPDVVFEFEPRVRFGEADRSGVTTRCLVEAGIVTASLESGFLHRTTHH